MSGPSRTIKLLALYGLTYIVISFINHLIGVIGRGNFEFKEIIWLSAKIPVLVLCLVVINPLKRGDSGAK